MTPKIDYWDEVTGTQEIRDATPEEDSEIEARKVAVPSISEFESMVQTYMDTVARSYGYDSLISAISYASDTTSPKWQQEGISFRSWRSSVWLKCIEILDSVKAGAKSPTEKELILMLPSLENMPA